MAKDPADVTELCEAAEVTDQEIDVAVDAVLADLATEAYPLAKGGTLDLVETLRTNTCAAEALTTDKAAWKRNMVRTAILLAHPVKGGARSIRAPMARQPPNAGWRGGEASCRESGGAARTREIIKRVVESEPSAGDSDLRAKARTWMLIAQG